MSEASNDPTQSVSAPDAQSRFRQKVVIWTIAAIVFLFWDDLLGLMLHVLHILLEYLELLTEEVLIHLFHLEEHEGQMLTAWLGLSSLIAILTWLYFLVRRKIKATFRSWAYFRSWLKVHAREHWISLTVITLFYLSYLFLF